jgi:DUF1707 SHOCT-like domain/Cell wall-active antibiotics response LiaF, C-terminal
MRHSNGEARVSRRPGYGQGVERRPSPRSLRASDSDRERVVAVLASAVADGRLTLEEHTERVTRAYSARTLGDLAELTSDLAVAAAQPLHLDGSRPAVAVFGNERRAGRWVVPESYAATAIFGEVSLDLTEALLQRPRIVMHVTAIFGNVHLLVPEGVAVQMGGTAILGGKVNHVRPVSADAPVIDIRAFTVFGAVTARTPKRRRWRGPRPRTGIGRIGRRAVDRG